MQFLIIDFVRMFFVQLNILCIGYLLLTVQAPTTEAYHLAPNQILPYMVQLNLNLTEHACSKGTTRHIFYFTRCKPAVHARLVTSNLLCKALVYALDMCTMHVCMSGMYTPNLDYMCMQIVNQGQRNKLYKHICVLRCNPPRDTRRKSC